MFTRGSFRATAAAPCAHAHTYTHANTLQYINTSYRQHDHHNPCQYIHLVTTAKFNTGNRQDFNCVARILAVFKITERIKLIGSLAPSDVYLSGALKIPS